MRITDEFWPDKASCITTVEVGPGMYVDVKTIFEDKEISYSYIMDNEDGTKIYDQYGLTHDVEVNDCTVCEYVERVLSK